MSLYRIRMVDYRVEQELTKSVKRFVNERLKLDNPEWDFVSVDIKLQELPIGRDHPFGEGQALIQIKLKNNGLGLL